MDKRSAKILRILYKSETKRIHVDELEKLMPGSKPYCQWLESMGYLKAESTWTINEQGQRAGKFTHACLTVQGADAIEERNRNTRRFWISTIISLVTIAITLVSLLIDVTTVCAK